MTGPIIGVVIAFFAAFAIIRKFQANMVLFLAALLLNIMATILEQTPSAKNMHDFTWLNFFEFAHASVSLRTLHIGFIILISGGFAAYMEAVGASARFVNFFMTPFEKIKRPYVILGIAFIFGNVIGFVVPSASGVAMLAIVTIYPLLVSLGCSPLSVAAVIASCQAVSYAPMSGDACLAAETVGLTPIRYLFFQQLPVAIPVIIVMAIAHSFMQRHYDEAVNYQPQNLPSTGHSADNSLLYAFLPLTPLLLMLTCNEFVLGVSSLGIASAMLLSCLITFFVDLCLRKEAHKSFKLSFAMFEGMGKIFTSTVALIFIAIYFAEGLRNIGLVNFLLTETTGLGISSHGSSILLCTIVGLITIITGSGNAAFVSLAHLVPDMARSLGIDPVATILMLNIASELLRAMSPVAGVVIIVAGYIHISPFEVVKRTWAPCLIGFLTMLTAITLELGR